MTEGTTKDLLKSCGVDVFRHDEKADISIVHGDCLDILPLLPEGCVDAVVTDPPYGISYVKGKGGGAGSYRGSRKSAAESRHHDPVRGDDKPFDPCPVLRFPNVLMWGANHYCCRLPEGKGRWIAWNKLEHLESFDSFSDVEFAWHSIGKVSRVFNFMWKGGLACRKNGENNGRREHPTQKPVGLMEWCIEQVRVDVGGTILDPFAGVCTTAVAAKRLGRRCICIELERKYCEIGKTRLKNEPMPMFVETPEPEKQAELFEETA